MTTPLTINVYPYILDVSKGFLNRYHIKATNPVLKYDIQRKSTEFSAKEKGLAKAQFIVRI